MTITQNQQIVSLMLRLQNMGCRIWAEDDKLRIRTSKNALTAELKQEIQNNKMKTKHKSINPNFSESKIERIQICKIQIENIPKLSQINFQQFF